VKLFRTGLEKAGSVLEESSTGIPGDYQRLPYNYDWIEKASASPPQGRSGGYLACQAAIIAAPDETFRETGGFDEGNITDDTQS
jgi:hypothetical protein